jgi:hypothetical protein
MKAATVSKDNSGILAIGSRITTVDVGVPKNTTIRGSIRNTHVAEYNHVVKNMNYLSRDTQQKKKWFMRGGRFFYYRPVLVLALLACIASIVAVLYYKKVMGTIAITISSIYILLSIYNIIVYWLNRPLLHPLLTIPVTDRELRLHNEFYKVPLQATTLTAALAAFIADAETYVATLKVQNVHRTEVTIMFYDVTYFPYSRFPKMSLFYLIYFAVVLGVTAASIVGAIHTIS